MLEEFDISVTLKEGEPLKQKVESLSGEQVKRCYQCGKCTAGCPVAFAMDNPPRQILRLLQLGLTEEALKSNSVWICATCETCYARCPRGVDIPRVMEAVRILAKKKGIVPERNIDLFSKLFLDSVEKNGRVHEMGLIVKHNLLSMQPFKDALLAPKLFFDGKISVFPHKIKNADEVRKIFERVREKEKGE